LDRIFTLVAQGFSVAVTAALVVVPVCIALALRTGVVDKPGGRKQHGAVTPLLGGVGVFAAAAAGIAVVQWQTAASAGLDLHIDEIAFVMAASLVMFLIGLVDDVFKDRMAFQLKLLGQIVGVLVLMGPRLFNLVTHGGGAPEWLYQLFFLGWYLTIVNSFNFSDNMNGLMSGLSIISFAASVVYLGSEGSLRSLVIAVVLVGALLGFMPYNFPRSRIFLGDAGSMFIGFWMAWVQFDMSRGFLGGLGEADLGFSNLIPAVLIMGVPLYDAAFVVFMRIVDRRPIYLGDNHHLSHRLVRGGFTPVEAVVILWGIGIVLAGVGVLSAFALPSYRYLLLAAAVAVMIAVTRVVMHFERRARAAGAAPAP
jgi:UDP-GlcNAc:undecaprenyl-phosphate/decaprenyl-phosphate GlcNAc-1-phosphate transferase